MTGLQHSSLSRPRPAAGADAGWPTGDLKPIGVRAGNGTVELLVGPEIAKAAALKPGVAVRFRMPAAEADITIEWPDLAGAYSGGQTTAAQPVTTPAAEAAGTPPPLPPPLKTAIAPATAKNIPVERGLSRLQRRGSAAMTATNAVATSAAGSAAPATNSAIVPAGAIAAPSRLLPNFLPLALGAVIVVAMLVMFLRTTTLEGSGVTLYSALRSTLEMPKEAAKGSPTPSAVLSDILEVGSKSPSGIDASDISQREALERANDLIATARTPKERAEAAFWLRKALSHGLSEPRLVWAVTQLGTAYASTENDAKPNYEAARLLWKWAADAGDAQAACFLGHVFERGLGVPSDARKAREHYEQARRMGGCPGLEQAMLRVRNAP